MSDRGWVLFRAPDDSDWQEEHRKGKWVVGWFHEGAYVCRGTLDFTCTEDFAFDTLDEAIAFLRGQLHE